jgi:hypothetical protein
VQAPHPNPFASSILRDSEPTQLFKRHQPALAGGNTCDLAIHAPPTGLKAAYMLAFRPVGPAGLGGGGGHAATVAELDARVVR